jgi:Holliday junction resolvase RusA-like endonuclease
MVVAGLTFGIMGLTFDVPGPAVPKARARVTSRGTFTPKRSRDYERAVKDAAWRAPGAFPWPMDARYQVTISIVPLLPKKPDAKPRGGDVDNVSKSILDALNGVLWMDDSQVSDVVVRRYAASRRPGVHVAVEATYSPPEHFGAAAWPEHVAPPRKARAPKAPKRR